MPVTHKELDSLYTQLSIDFERLLKKADRYEHALQTIAGGSSGPEATYLAKEALEPRD